ncbi:MAG: hypothetical protein J5I90_05965 [Caldilineales bacterium]|nr:hypothetical protein [Caldilineales bacterium]
MSELEADKSFLSQGQGDRFDRWVEFASAIVLALATALTAWCGYQAAQWDGEQAKSYTEAVQAQVEAARLDGLAATHGSVQVGLFSQWVDATAAENQDLADFYYERFPPALAVATAAWLETKPLTNPDAPSSPFVMPEYQLPEQQAAQQKREEAKAKFVQANDYNDISDRFVLLTVLFATVLFFAGISGKFQWRALDLAMLVIGVVVMAVGLLLIILSPMIL